MLARFSLTPIAPLDDHEPSGNRAPSAECDSERPAAVDTEAVGVSCQLVTVGVGPSKRPTALSETAAFVGGAATSTASKISSAADEIHNCSGVAAEAAGALPQVVQSAMTC